MHIKRLLHTMRAFSTLLLPDTIAIVCSFPTHGLPLTEPTGDLPILMSFSTAGSLYAPFQQIHPYVPSYYSSSSYPFSLCWMLSIKPCSLSAYASYGELPIPLLFSLKTQAASQSWIEYRGPSPKYVPPVSSISSSISSPLGLEI